MKFLNEDDYNDIIRLDKDVKNKFRLDWLKKKDCNGDEIAKWCKKVAAPGECFCIWCSKSFRYDNDGVKALLSHATSMKHKSWKTSVGNSLNLYSYSGTTTPNSEEAKTLDLNTRKVRVESLICSFIGEHSLPFSIGPDLINLAKILNKDPKALEATHMNRTTVAYKMKYGLANALQNRIVETLKKVKFSLNLDESTSKSSKSVLTVLAQYFCPEQNNVVIQHLVSFSLNVGTAANIYNQLVEFIERNEIPWENLVSILMDSCNTMRGTKKGVETLIRTKKAPHLLDIDGDTCHTVNNSAKQFTKPFNMHIESLCDNVHFDLESVDKRNLFFEICAVIEINQLAPLSRPSHRWLYVLPAIDRIVFLWDALLIYYYSFMTKSDQELYKTNLEAIYEKRNLTEDKLLKLSKIQGALKSKKLTKQGGERKQKIIKSLFILQKKTLLQIAVYKDILPIFNGYIKMFQKKEPMIHEIHVQLFNMFKKTLSFFIKHELISNCKNVKDIRKVDLESSDNQLPEQLLYLGPEATKIISSLKKKDHSVLTFKKQLKDAYVQCAKYMLAKLPLDNSTLICLSGLDPFLRGQTATYLALIKLANKASSVLTDSEKDALDLEVRNYQIDDKISDNMIFDITISNDLKEMKSPKRIDEYWAAVSGMTLDGARASKYPILTKLVKAVISCFHGPVVESAFSFMENIVTEHRASLNIQSLNSYQTVKYDLLAKKTSSLETFNVADPITTPVERDLLNSMLNSWSTYEKSLNEGVPNISQCHKTPHNQTNIPQQMAEKRSKTCPRKQMSTESINQNTNSVPMPDKEQLCSNDIHTPDMNVLQSSTNIENCSGSLTRTAMQKKEKRPLDTSSKPNKKPKCSKITSFFSKN